MPNEKKEKVKTLRHMEYYDMVDRFDELYSRSQRGEHFKNLMGIISSEENIKLAYRNIKRNSGSLTAGTDKKTIRDIEGLTQEEYVAKAKNKLKWYKPKPVRRVEIPKPGSDKKRPLGIPCIWDRIVQQCILQVLEPICEAKFSNNSYGFRPNRSAENAIAVCAFNIQHRELSYVVDIDIKGFFDNVCHTKLIRQIWAMGIRDCKLISIIKEMLKAPIKMPTGETVIPEKGTPQGGILSPLLSNIVLNELDWWVASQWETFPTRHEYVSNYKSRPNKHNYNTKNRALRTTKLKEIYMVRYADDFKIFCRDYDTAKRTFIAVKNWLKERLKLDSHIIQFLLGYTSSRKLMHYAQKQFDLYAPKSDRHYNMDRLLTTFRDYLNMCLQLEYDLTNDFVLFPRYLEKSHDKVTHLIKKRKMEIYNKQIKEQFPVLQKLYQFKHKDYMIVVPRTAKEITKEGHTLHHCVGSYISSVAKQQCTILFVRSKAEPKKPLCTVEIRDNTVRQARCLRNQEPSDEIKAFLDLWEERVLQAEQKQSFAA